MRGERPDVAQLQDVKPKMRSIRHDKVIKVGRQSNVYILAEGRHPFISQSRLGDGQVASQEGHAEQHHSTKLASRAHVHDDHGYTPNAVAVGTGTAQSGLQWSDTEPDSDLGPDSDKEIRDNAETLTTEQIVRTAFYRNLPQPKTRIIPPHKAKAKREI
ncbi:hypothetical protein LTR56_023368, partial [Elasticomyces elasticus]